MEFVVEWSLPTAQYEDVLLPFNAEQMSGARLALVKAARTVTLTVRTARLVVLDADASMLPATIFATSSGKPVCTVQDTIGPYTRLLDLAGAQRPVDGGEATLEFDIGSGPDGNRRLVGIWLPHTAAVELLDITADDGLAAADPPAAPR